jgi:hypothetical protein
LFHAADLYRFRPKCRTLPGSLITRKSTRTFAFTFSQMDTVLMSAALRAYLFTAKTSAFSEWLRTLL